jgi:hypothetical protein
MRRADHRSARRNPTAFTDKGRMIYAIPLLVSCAISIWFCYWSTGVFATLRNRPCRIACFATPVVLAALLLTFADALLDPLYEAMPAPLLFNWLGGATGEFIIALAILETVFALLVTALVSEFLKVRARNVLRQK